MLFSTRPSELTRADIERVVSQKVPEGPEVEFKERLSTKDGKPHPWQTTGGEIGGHARDKLLEEVVAFANTYGGWLLVGIEETKEKPARAAAVAPLRACADLAERLRLMCRDCIDPQPPVLEVEGVPTQDSDAGVVVFHVPRSRLAPHRLKPTKECYRRHADRTEVMDMREIQDLTLQVERGMAAVDRRFKEQQEKFDAHFKQFRSAGNNAHTFGIRATLLSLMPTYIDRVHGNYAVRPPQHALWCVTQGGSTYKLSIPENKGTWRSTIRGSVLRQSGEGYSLLQEVHCDSLLEYRFLLRKQERENRLYLHVNWIMGMFCNAVCAAEKFRRAVGAPNVEYGLEVEILNRGPGELYVSNYSIGPLDNLLGPFPHGDDTFPRYSIGPREEFQKLAKMFERDFWDAVGYEPSSLVEVDFDRAFGELGMGPA